MEIINISERQFKKLHELELANSVFNTESRIYIYPEKNGWKKNDKLLKRFYLTSGINFGNKLKTINSLLDVKEKCTIDSLVFPDSLAAIDSQVVAYTMPWIKSVTLKEVLDDFYVPIEEKIEYLKQIGKILRDMKNIRTYQGVSDFFLNDVHECNFVVEQGTNKVYAVDLDSAKIDNNLTFGSNYLSCHSPIHDVGKYRHVDDDRCGGIILPDENTDLYCYIVIILNLLFNGKITKLELSAFYNYLDYLNSLGLNKELIDIFARIYDNSPNENPVYLLDYIKDVYPRSLFPVYKRKQ